MLASVTRSRSALLRKPLTVSAIGAPTSAGQGLPGTELGPAALRGDGALERLVTSLGWCWFERGDVATRLPAADDPVAAGGAKNSFAVGRSNEALAAAVESALREGHFALTLGGDHSVALGSIAGLLRVHARPGIVWVDAHADINTPSSSPSGNIHGMPLSFLLNSGASAQAALPGHEWLGSVPPLDPRDLVYIGLRDLDPAEKSAIKAHKIRAFTMHDVDKFGIGGVMEQALAYLNTTHLHLSFDIDGCDPAIAPSTGTTVPGGLSFREAHFIAEACARTGLLASMDMVEVNPALGGDAAAAATVALGRALIGSALGKDILE